MSRAALLLTVAFAVPALAQTAEHVKEGGRWLEANAVVAVEYDIRPLLYKPGSARAGFDSVEKVIREDGAAVRLHSRALR